MSSLGPTLVRWLVVLSFVLAATPALGEDTGARRAVFVFDASGSMLEEVEGRTRVAVAREVLGEALATVDPSVELGLVAFGHRRSKDCTDLEMVVPLGAGWEALSSVLAALRPRGETPLAEAVALAARALGEGGEGGSIVVVSDGKEECGGDPCASARAAAEARASLRIHVIGFDVGPEADDQLGCVAEAGRGRYFRAEDAGDLAAALGTIVRLGDGVEPCPPTFGNALTPDAPIRCRCSAEAVAEDGIVWGTDVYTTDSAFCRAALHAGALAPAGGVIRARPEPGREAYEGSVRNGVASLGYEAYPTSVVFTAPD